MLPKAHTTGVPVKSGLHSQEHLTDATAAILSLSLSSVQEPLCKLCYVFFLIYLFLRQDLTVMYPRLASTPQSCFCLLSSRITDVSTTLAYLSSTYFAISSWYDECIRVDKALPVVYANIFCSTEVLFIELIKPVCLSWEVSMSNLGCPTSVFLFCFLLHQFFLSFMVYNGSLCECLHKVPMCVILVQFKQNNSCNIYIYTDEYQLFKTVNPASNN